MSIAGLIQEEVQFTLRYLALSSIRTYCLPRKLTHSDLDITGGLQIKSFFLCILIQC